MFVHQNNYVHRIFRQKPMGSLRESDLTPYIGSFQKTRVARARLYDFFSAIQYTGTVLALCRIPSSFPLLK